MCNGRHTHISIGHEPRIRRFLPQNDDTKSMLARIVLSPRVRARNRSAVANIYIPILAETVVPLSYIVHLLSLTFYTFRSFSFSMHRPNCITLQALYPTRTLDFSNFPFEKFCWFLARDTYVLIFNDLYLYKLFANLVKFSRSRFI